MSTANVVADAGVDIAVKTDNVTYQVYVKLDADGKVIEKETRCTSSEKEQEALGKEDSGYTLALEQTVKSYKAGTLEGARQIIGSDEELVNIINRGIAAKFNQKVQATLKEFNSEAQALVFEPVDVFDSLELLQEETQRKSLSPTEKVLKGLRGAGFTDAQIQAALAALTASSTPAE